MSIQSERAAEFQRIQYEGDDCPENGWQEYAEYLDALDRDLPPAEPEHPEPEEPNPEWHNGGGEMFF